MGAPEAYETVANRTASASRCAATAVSTATASLAGAGPSGAGSIAARATRTAARPTTSERSASRAFFTGRSGVRVAGISSLRP